MPEPSLTITSAPVASNTMGSASPASSAQSSSSTTAIPPAGRRGRKRSLKADSVETTIMESLVSLREEKHAEHLEDDEDVLFGRQIAAVLKRFSNHQKATAKLRIQQVLVETEFCSFVDPSSQYTC